MNPCYYLENPSDLEDQRPTDGVDGSEHDDSDHEMNYD